MAKINKLNNDLILDIKSQSDFIRFDATDTSYFLTHSSSNLVTHSRLSRDIKEGFASLSGDKNITRLNIKTDIDSLVVLFNNIDTEFAKIIVDIKLRGFKDFGVEGEMRKYAHMLEASDINPTLVLSLRRHEKDYIIRKELQYIEKLNNLGIEFKKYIYSRPDRGLVYKDSIEDILDKYIFEFNTLVKLEEEIGLYKNEGLRQNLEKLFDSAENVVDNINNKANESKIQLFTSLEKKAIWFFTALLIIIVISSIYLSRYITLPMKILTRHISKVTESHFQISEFPDIRSSDDETAILFSEFKHMIRQLNVREAERDQAEEALKENENKYRNLADLLPQSIFETDSDCKLTYFNKTMAVTFGFDDSVLKGNYSITNILKTECSKLLESENSSGVDFMAYKNNGEVFPVLLYVTRIFTGGSFAGLRGIMVDITEKIRYTEELKEQKLKAELADKLKSAFLANMSHEIRTPLNSIVGFSQILTGNNLDARTRLEYAEYIRNSSDLLLKIINDILDLAKIESGQLKIIYSFFDLNSLFNKIHKESAEIKKNFKKEGLQIRISKYFKDQQFFIYSDPHRIEQVFSNLFTNAIKFTDTGLIEIGYRIINNEKVEFFVKDTGIGIEPDRLNLIFERFSQIEDPGNIHYEGAGLGLSISKSIIGLLGGSIWVESVPGEGSVFYFEIPLVGNYTLKSNSENEFLHPVDHNSARGNKLLIAEDVDSNFMVLKEGLKPLGMEILWGKNGAEAVNILAKDPEISVVLMDMRMPVMDGYEATKRMKEINPDVKIIATTANAMAGEKERCLKAGCNCYMSKPLQINQLMDKICEYTANQIYREVEN